MWEDQCPRQVLILCIGFGSVSLLYSEILFWRQLWWPLFIKEPSQRLSGLTFASRGPSVERWSFPSEKTSTSVVSYSAWTFAPIHSFSWLTTASTETYVLTDFNVNGEKKDPVKCQTPTFVFNIACVEESRKVYFNFNVLRVSFFLEKRVWKSYISYI